jgi:hypothetical protein
MKIEQELEVFKTLTDRMNEIFAAKRCDYGPSTEETFKRYGAVSMLVRMRDKLNRLDNLLVNQVQRSVYDERVEDTLLDLANYSLIAILELLKAQSEVTRNDNAENLHGTRN